MRFVPVVLVFLGASAQAQHPPIPTLGHREAAFVAGTPDFRFHSDFWLNLHDYLHGLVGGGPGPMQLDAEGTACFAVLPAEDRQAWEDGVSFYRAEMAERHHRRDPIMRAVRYRLANLATEQGFDPDVEALLDRLRGVAPAYRACLWESHDARNRARIGDLLDHVVRYGPALTDTLGVLYHSGWPQGVVVDVTPYASAAGANTTTGPDEAPHMMLSNLDPDVEGFSGLELILHEASHIVFGFRHGEVARALHGAADSLGVEMPGALWHALSFHTSGWAVQQIAASEGITYDPYWLRKNVYPDYHEAVANYWQPYLDGATTMDAAALALIQALT